MRPRRIRFALRTLLRAVALAAILMRGVPLGLQWVAWYRLSRMNPGARPNLDLTGFAHGSFVDVEGRVTRGAVIGVKEGHGGMAD